MDEIWRLMDEIWRLIRWDKRWEDKTKEMLKKRGDANHEYLIKSLIHKKILSSIFLNFEYIPSASLSLAS